MLPRGMILEAQSEPIEQVRFPSSGVTSVVVQGSDGRRIEVGPAGREGMSGLPVVMSDDRATHEGQEQVAGAGHRVAVEALQEAMSQAGGLREALLRFVHAFGVQASHTALANGRYAIGTRLARWLLMCHDRMDDDALELTHEFMGLMLGVRRASVTVALHELEGRGLIKAMHGLVRVLDRAGLEGAVGASYGPAEAEYARLLGPGWTVRWDWRRPPASGGARGATPARPGALPGPGPQAGPQGEHAAHDHRPARAAPPVAGRAALVPARRQGRPHHASAARRAR